MVAEEEGTPGAKYGVRVEQGVSRKRRAEFAHSMRT